MSSVVHYNALGKVAIWKMAMKYYIKNNNSSLPFYNGISDLLCISWNKHRKEYMMHDTCHKYNLIFFKENLSEN